MSDDAKFHPSEEISIYSRNKRRLLLAMVALFAIYGLFLGFFPADVLRVAAFATSIAFAILVVSWCAQDRAERNIRPWRGFAFFVVVFPTALVMMPLYLLRTRGTSGVKSTALAAAFFFAICLMASIIAAFVGLLRTA
jgi:hypothetical protein